MKKYFLFSFLVQERPGKHYQCLVFTKTERMPDLNELCNVLEYHLKKHSVKLQYFCHSEFESQERLKQFLGKLYKSADVYLVDEKGLITRKKIAE